MSTPSPAATLAVIRTPAATSTGTGCSPSAVLEDRTPARALRLSEQNPAHHDTEALARVLASHCFPVPCDSEQIEYAYAVIRAADAARMSCAQYLTGVKHPQVDDYGAPRRLNDGRFIAYSTRAEASTNEREIAARCIIGAIADPQPFWDYCKLHDLTERQTRVLAAFAQIKSFSSVTRLRGLVRCAKVYHLKLEDLLTLRLWW